MKNLGQKKKNIVLIGLLLFIITFLVAPAYAASSTFLTEATKYFTKKCSIKVKGEQAIGCYLFDRIAELNSSLSNIIIINNSQTQQIDELKVRVELLEASLSAIVTPTSNPTYPEITVSSGQSFFVPSGYKSMTIKLKNVSNLPSWAPTVSFDGYTYKEQIRFNGDQQNITIPILGNNYRLNKGGPTDFLADITFNTENESKVILFGNSISYSYLSDSFDTNGFSSITFTAGGGDNPQHLTAITLLKPLSNGGYENQNQIACDGGAVCPLQTMSVDGSVYRVRLEGLGSNAVLGAILRK